MTTVKKVVFTDSRQGSATRQSWDEMTQQTPQLGLNSPANNNNNIKQRRFTRHEQENLYFRLEGG